MKKTVDNVSRKEIAKLQREFKSLRSFNQVIGLLFIIGSVLYDFYAVLTLEQFEPGLGSNQIIMIAVGVVIYLMNWRRA